MSVTLDMLVPKEDVVRTTSHDVDKHDQNSLATSALQALLKSELAASTISNFDVYTSNQPKLAEKKSIDNFSEVFRSLVSTDNDAFDFPDIGWTNDDVNTKDDLEEEKRLEEFMQQEKKRIKLSHGRTESLSADVSKQRTLSRSRTTWFDLSSAHGGRNFDYSCGNESIGSKIDKTINMPSSYSHGHLLQKGKRMRNESIWID
jgi:hypothetical protein